MAYGEILIGEDGSIRTLLDGEPYDVHDIAFSEKANFKIFKNDARKKMTPGAGPTVLLNFLFRWGIFVEFSGS